MRAFVFLLAVCSVAAGAQVRLEVELGWGGRVAAGEVSPLWVRVLNEFPYAVVGDVVVRERVGSAWRGEGDRRMRRPLPIGPAGSAQLVLPWPGGHGRGTLTVYYEVEGREVASAEVAVEPARYPITLHVGSPERAVEPGTVVVPPDDLVSDPLLYSGVGGVAVDAGLVLGPEIERAIRTWELLLAGLSHPSGEEIRDAFARSSLGSDLWWWYLAGTVAYVLGAAWVLRRWGKSAERADRAGGALLVVGLVLFGAVWSPIPLTFMRTTWAVQHYEDTSYEVAWSALFSRGERTTTLDGLWLELPVVDQPLASRQLRWSWEAGAWRTRVSIVPGRPLVLWTLGARRPSLDMEELDPQVAEEDGVWSAVRGDSDWQAQLVALEEISRQRGTQEVRRVLLWAHTP